MTEETSATQVSFYPCLCHETKKAYAPWLKVVIAILIIAGVFALAAYYKDTIVDVCTQFIQLTNIVPWYVYIFATLLLMPLVYATGVCINKRVEHSISENICLVSLILALVIILLGAGLLNTLFFSLGVIVFTFSIGLVSGIARD
jgi:uncharacterized membrane protein